MKKNITINIYGTLYNIDDDAYDLLENYLNNMKRYFSGTEGGDEIADDIEHRVSELFWEIKGRKDVITIDDVKDVINTIGDPSEMSDESHEDPKTGNGPSGGGSSFSGSQASDGKSSRNMKRLYRDTRDKLLGGVFSGLCAYLGVNDPIWFRLGFVVLFFFSSSLSSALVIGYFIMCLIVPEAKTAEDRLRMRGMDVNPQSINEETIRQSETGDEGNGAVHKVANGFLSFLIFCFKIIISVIAFGLLALLLVFGFAIIMCIVGGSAALLQIGMTPEVVEFLGTSSWLFYLCVISGIAVFLIPIATIIRLIFMSNKSMSKSSSLLILLMWIIAMILFVVTSISIFTKAKDVIPENVSRIEKVLNRLDIAEDDFDDTDSKSMEIVVEKVLNDIAADLKAETDTESALEDSI